MSDGLIQHRDEVTKLMEPGLYRIDHGTVCAGFVVMPNGMLGKCAPVLRNKWHWWKTKATWIGE